MSHKHNKKDQVAYSYIKTFKKGRKKVLQSHLSEVSNFGVLRPVNQSGYIRVNHLREHPVKLSESQTQSIRMPTFFKVFKITTK